MNKNNNNQDVHCECLDILIELTEDECRKYDETGKIYYREEMSERMNEHSDIFKYI